MHRRFFRHGKYFSYILYIDIPPTCPSVRIKKSQKSFNRNDIVKYHLQDFRHTDIARYIHSSHTDYVPVLEMKDGSAIILPFSFCREPYKAEELVSKVKSDKDFSKKTMFGF